MYDILIYDMYIYIYVCTVDTFHMYRSKCRPMIAPMRVLPCRLKIRDNLWMFRSVWTGGWPKSAWFSLLKHHKSPHICIFHYISHFEPNSYMCILHVCGRVLRKQQLRCANGGFKTYQAGGHFAWESYSTGFDYSAIMDVRSKLLQQVTPNEN